MEADAGVKAVCLIQGFVGGWMLEDIFEWWGHRK
jgi:hypothetical protein